LLKNKASKELISRPLLNINPDVLIPQWDAAQTSWYQDQLLCRQVNSR